jgi:hypothetical protein
VPLLPKSGGGNRVITRGITKGRHNDFILERDRGARCHETDDEADHAESSPNRCTGDGGTIRLVQPRLDGTPAPVRIGKHRLWHQRGRPRVGYSTLVLG